MNTSNEAIATRAAKLNVVLLEVHRGTQPDHGPINEAT